MAEFIEETIELRYLAIRELEEKNTSVRPLFPSRRYSFLFTRVATSRRNSCPHQLLDGVGAVNPNGLSAGGGFGLVHGAFDAVGHEVNRRVGSRPSGGDVVGKYECPSPSVISALALGLVERASTGEHGTKSGREIANMLGARLRHLERHGIRPSGVEFDVPEVKYQSNTSATPSLRSAT
jgi:hypothetical protein